MKPIRVDMLYFAKLAELSGAATVLRSLMHGFGDAPHIALRAWARDACALAPQRASPRCLPLQTYTQQPRV